jgi:hypothetical protein
MLRSDRLVKSADDNERDIRTAYHEAGHALARFVAKQGCDEIRALSKAEWLALKAASPGKAIPVGGLSGTFNFTSPPMFETPEGAHWSEYVPAEQSMVDCANFLRGCYAGAAAEAHFMKLSIKDDEIMGFCKTDMDHADMCINTFWNPAEKYRKKLHKAARRAAQELIESPEGQDAIQTMATRLMQTGLLKGNAIASICERSFDKRRHPMSLKKMARVDDATPLKKNFYSDEKAWGDLAELQQGARLQQEEARLVAENADLKQRVALMESTQPNGSRVS